jgi:hypothetical protein
MHVTWLETNVHARSFNAMLDWQQNLGWCQHGIHVDQVPYWIGKKKMTPPYYCIYMDHYSSTLSMKFQNFITIRLFF